MGLLDDIAAEQRHGGTSCRVAGVLEAMTEDDRADLLQAIKLGLQASSISRALRARGWDVAGNTIARHRRGECRCPTS